MPWRNPFISAGILVSPDLRSRDYVPGVSGWIITSNPGFAEFSSLITSIISSVSQINMIDVGGLITLRTNQTNMVTMEMSSVGADTNSSTLGGLVVETLNFGNANEQLQARWGTGHPSNTTDDASLIMLSEAADSSSLPNAVFSCPLNVVGTFSVDGVDQGKGLLDNTIISASTAAVGNTETVALSLPSLDYAANRAYRVVFEGNHTVSVANNSTSFKVRKTNTAGQQLQDIRFPALTTTTNWAGFSTPFITSSALSGVTLVLTIQGGAAFNSTINASGTRPAILSVYDIGPSSDYTGLPTLT